MYRLRRGLGDTLKADSSGNIIDCDLWSNILQPVCWNPFSPTVTEPALPNPPMPSAPTVPAQVYQQQAGQPDILLQSPSDTTVAASAAGGVQQTQANTQSFFNALPSDIGTSPNCVSSIVSPFCDSTVYIVAAVGVGVILLMTYSAGKKRR